MYKKIIVLLLTISILLMVGCSGESKPPLTNVEKFQKQCLDGVVYYISRESSGGYRGYGYMSVKYNQDGTVETCW